MNLGMRIGLLVASGCLSTAIALGLHRLGMTSTAALAGGAIMGVVVNGIFRNMLERSEEEGKEIIA